MTDRPMKDYTQLKELLEKQETFPLRFTYKFIGRNTPRFERGVLELETAFPALRHEHTRASSGGQHLSKTYGFDAQNAEAIIEIFRAIERIQDILIVL